MSADDTTQPFDPASELETDILPGTKKGDTHQYSEADRSRVDKDFVLPPASQVRPDWLPSPEQGAVGAHLLIAHTIRDLVVGPLSFLLGKVMDDYYHGRNQSMEPGVLNLVGDDAIDMATDFNKGKLNPEFVKSLQSAVGYANDLMTGPQLDPETENKLLGNMKELVSTMALEFQALNSADRDQLLSEIKQLASHRDEVATARLLKIEAEETSLKDMVEELQLTQVMHETKLKQLLREPILKVVGGSDFEPENQKPVEVNAPVITQTRPEQVYRQKRSSLWSKVQTILLVSLLILVVFGAAMSELGRRSRLQKELGDADGAQPKNSPSAPAIAAVDPSPSPSPSPSLIVDKYAQAPYSISMEQRFAECSNLPDAPAATASTSDSAEAILKKVYAFLDLAFSRQEPKYLWCIWKGEIVPDSYETVADLARNHQGPYSTRFGDPGFYNSGGISNPIVTFTPIFNGQPGSRTNRHFVIYNRRWVYPEDSSYDPVWPT